ncbi:MAG TPA: family 78 glycoside hydrolase catalytic domain [Phycisphaerae bacterium]|nr:family 78 glycoside hydrolase catalytic domain [Phycisphaerae bacterium]
MRLLGTPAAAGVVLVLATTATADLTPTRLRCEYAVNPLGIDEARPQLSWAVESRQRGQVQTAYQILVATTEDVLQADRGDLWDSGKVSSSRTVGVPYAGKPLQSGMRAHWKVRVWDKDGDASDWSPPAWWEMGLLEPGDWQGPWITRSEGGGSDADSRGSGSGAAGSGSQSPPADPYGEHPAPMFRKEFVAPRAIRQARLYISGLGYYELHINGERVGDRVLDPAWTSYAKRVFYSTYDVTALLRKGPNALGVILGNGWYNPLPLRMWGKFNLRDALTVGEPRFILQLNIEYVDGTRQSVCSDGSWRVGDSPILKNSVYLGEVYDARREQQGWDAPGFDDARWRPAVATERAAHASATAPASLGTLRAQSVEPITITRSIKPVQITEPKPGTYIFDMGQNFAGWVTLRVSAPAGTAIRLRYGELLHSDGTLNVMTSVCGQIKQAGMGGPGAPPLAYQSETYICRGSGPEVYTPRFTFHGFRYVEVTGCPDRPTLDAIEGRRLNAAVDEVGSFECSNPLFNRIHEIVRWTLLSNLFSVQSDCPHREKFGYGGDIVASSEAAIFNLDMARFYAKAVHDLDDAVRPNGGMTETAPFVGIADEGLGDGSGPVGWGTAHPLLQWHLRQYYGNERLLREQYDRTKRWVALLESKAVDGILDNGISDHESLTPKPRALTGTAFYYYNVRLLAQIAAALQRKADADRYAALAETIKAAFNRRFLVPGTGRYDAGTQTCQAFALYFGLVPETERQAALDVLVHDVMTARGGHLSTGIFGTKYMLNALTDLGRADVAYTIVNQKTFPGWGHMLENGATTLWEHWAFSDNTYSHNHPMFGSVSEWLFKAVAGINPAPDAVGFDRIIIRPHVAGGLTRAAGRYESIRGPVVSEWRIDGDAFVLDVTIPANTTALVYVPSDAGSAIREGDRAAAEAEGVEHVRSERGAAVFRIGSGTYRFISRCPAGRTGG